MKPWLIIVFISIIYFPSHAQPKVYFDVGTNFSTTYFIEGFYRLGVGSRIYVTETDYQSKSLGSYWNAELTVETRINKLLYGVTGLSWYQCGYYNKVSNFYSNFDATYLGIPLLLRVNFVNAVHLDVGFIGRIPVKAILEETGNQGTQFQTYAKEDIASSLSRFNLGGHAQVTFLFNRFTLAFYLSTGQNTVDRNFLDEWPLGNQSMFLRDVFPKFKYQMSGMKLGFRVK